MSNVKFQQQARFFLKTWHNSKGQTVKQEVVHGRFLQGGSDLLTGPVHLQRRLQSAETSRLLRER